jgi:hypothetical protein
MNTQKSHHLITNSVSSDVTQEQNYKIIKCRFNLESGSFYHIREQLALTITPWHVRIYTFLPA